MENLMGLTEVTNFLRRLRIENNFTPEVHAMELEFHIDNVDDFEEILPHNA
jgi:hypothetical protein